MRVFFQIAYFVMGIVQLFAIWDGFKYMFGVGSFVGFILAFFTAYIPLVGPAVGMYGAVKVWDWGILQSFLLFFWYIILWVAVVGLEGLKAARVR